MKKLISTILLTGALAASALTANAGVDTYLNWGFYINCDVYNNSPVGIQILQTNYSLQTPFGLVNKFYNCVGNCYIPPYSSMTMGGPANPPEVRWGTCNVNYRMY